MILYFPDRRWEHYRLPNTGRFLCFSWCTVIVEDHRKVSESRFLFCDMSSSEWHFRCDHTCSLFRVRDGSLLFGDQTWGGACYEVPFDSSRCSIPSCHPCVWITVWLRVILRCYGCHDHKALASCCVLPPVLVHIFKQLVLKQLRPLMYAGV